MLPLLLVLLPYDTWFSGLVLLLISSILLKITHMTVADRVNLRVKSGKMGSGKMGSGKMGGNHLRRISCYRSTTLYHQWWYCIKYVKCNRIYCVSSMHNVKDLLRKCDIKHLKVGLGFTVECMRKRVFALSICAFVRSSAESADLTCALKRQIRWRLQIWFAIHVYHAASW